MSDTLLKWQPGRDDAIALEGYHAGSVLDQERAAVLVIDPVHDRIVDANASASRLLGYAREELRNTRVSELHPDDMAELRALASEVVHTGGVHTHALSCLTKSGTLLPTQISAAFIEGDSGVRIIALVNADPRPPEGSHGARPPTVARLEHQLTEREHELARQRRLRLEAQQALARVKTRMREQTPDSATSWGGEAGAREIVGVSDALRETLLAIERVAATDASVLITGESGTGKELVARALHEQSRRRTAPLVRVNCAAIPRDLFESEFFGHVKGAFTGASADRAGRFERANGGTLFLDEVGEIPLALQGKLLRALQEGAVDRIGGSGPRKVDVRIVAASNRDLDREVREQRFRPDLFYRLNVFPIHIPPLRQRPQDIVPLAEHFVARAKVRLGRPDLHIRPADRAQLECHDWPGNVRELQNMVERGIILADGDGRVRLEPPRPCVLDHPPATAIGATAYAPLSRGYLTEEERRERDRASIIAALEAAGGKVAGANGAAALLGLKASTLASRMRTLGITPPRGG